MTDKEKRIFLSAMSRERKVCKEVDQTLPNKEPYEISLVSVCNSIEYKVKHSHLWIDEDEKEDETYVSENGFTGKMYGERSFSIYNSDGKEVFHTGFRAFNDRKGLIEAVDDFPELIKLLRGEE